MKDIAVQLYSVRNAINSDAAGALKKIRKMGYMGVEFAGFYGMAADEMAALLKETGLKPVSSHVSMGELRDNFEETVEYHKTIGCVNITVPQYTFHCMGCVKSFAAEMSGLAEDLQPHGIRLHYHNHEQEFEKLDGKYILDHIMELAPGIGMELDLCWCYVGGQDVGEYISLHKDRISLVHFKDCARKGEQIIHGHVGEGDLDFAALSKLLRDDAQIIVEDEVGCDSFDGIEIAAGYLDGIL